MIEKSNEELKNWKQIVRFTIFQEFSILFGIFIKIETDPFSSFLMNWVMEFTNRPSKSHDSQKPSESLRYWLAKRARQSKLENRGKVRIEIIQKVSIAIINFQNNKYYKIYQLFYKLMCKISFTHIIEENSLRKGLFQLLPYQKIDTHNIQESSTNPEEQIIAQNAIEEKTQRECQMQDSILTWFKEKLIYRGNPEDLIHSHIQKQKSIIMPKKIEFNLLPGIKVIKNNLLLRRSAKLLQMNVTS